VERLTDTEGACLAFRPSIGPLSQRTPHFAIGRYGELKSVENSGRPTGLFIAAGSVFRGAKESLAQPTSIQTGLRPADSDPLVFVTSVTRDATASSGYAHDLQALPVKLLREDTSPAPDSM
jgi:hypothetical protein